MCPEIDAQRGGDDGWDEDFDGAKVPVGEIGWYYSAGETDGVDDEEYVEGV